MENKNNLLTCILCGSHEIKGFFKYCDEIEKGICRSCYLPVFLKFYNPIKNTGRKRIKLQKRFMNMPIEKVESINDIEKWLKGEEI